MNTHKSIFCFLLLTLILTVISCKKDEETPTVNVKTELELAGKNTKQIISLIDNAFKTETDDLKIAQLHYEKGKALEMASEAKI